MEQANQLYKEGVPLHLPLWPCLPGQNAWCNGTPLFHICMEPPRPWSTLWTPGFTLLRASSSNRLMTLQSPALYSCSGDWRVFQRPIDKFTQIMINCEKWVKFLRFPKKLVLPWCSVGPWRRITAHVVCPYSGQPKDNLCLSAESREAATLTNNFCIHIERSCFCRKRVFRQKEPASAERQKGDFYEKSVSAYFLPKFLAERSPKDPFGWPLLIQF